MIVCDHTHVLGVAQVSEILSKDGTKAHSRCPTCSSSKFEERKTLQPRYKCRNGHVFEELSVQNEPCTNFTAVFSDFQRCTSNVDRTFLRDGCPRYIAQGAMQEFVPALIANKLQTEAPELYRLLNKQRGSSDYLKPDDAVATNQPLPEYEPTDGDERKRAMQLIARRRGQRQFRQNLRDRYGDTCLVSGCTAVDAIEAAHILPYRGENENHPDNGLLLRADLHTLFDLDLIGINPQTLEVHLHPWLAGCGYDDLSGRRLCFTGVGPSAVALAERWKCFQRRAAINVMAASA